MKANTSNLRKTYTMYDNSLDSMVDCKNDCYTLFLLQLSHLQYDFDSFLIMRSPCPTFCIWVGLEMFPWPSEWGEKDGRPTVSPGIKRVCKSLLSHEPCYYQVNNPWIDCRRISDHMENNPAVPAEATLDKHRNITVNMWQSSQDWQSSLQPQS